ncbi:MAG: glycosyltransferase family 39 protein [Acidimicrobiia bacterium]
MRTSPEAIDEATRAPVPPPTAADGGPSPEGSGRDLIGGVPGGVFPAWVWKAAPFVVGAFVVAGLILRFVARSELWLDEALTVNIAQVPFGDLVDTLKRDGSPPLFYVLLHVWIDLFGDSNVAVRALSGIFAVATLPAMWFAGRRLGGRTVAWLAFLLLTLSPFAIRYATEARPYSLQILLVTLGVLALRRAFERPAPGRLAVVALVTGLLLYDAYWSLYLVGVTVVYLVVRSWRDAEPHPARRTLAAVIVGCATFIPWVPTFLHQLEHTGTPWATPIALTTATGRAVIEFGGGFVPAGWLMGPVLGLVALLGVFGVAIDRRRIELDLFTRPVTRHEAAVGFGTLLVGGGIAWVTAGAFEARYAAVVLPMYLLVAAVGLLAFASRELRMVVVVALLALGLAGGIEAASVDRTQAGEVADVVNSRAAPGDIVGFCPDQVGPAVARIVDADVDMLAWPDGASPEFVDWTDYAERNAATDPSAYAQILLDAAGDDGTVWLVWAAGYRTLEGSCEAVVTALQGARPDTETMVTGSDEFYEFQSLTRFGPREP